MTIITIDRATVEQALEALEWHLERGAYGADIEGVTGNLRAALAQQAEPVVGVVWSVDWGRDGDRACASIVKKRADGSAEIVAVEYAPYTAPPQQVTPSMDEITRLRAERDALAQRLREVRALLADTTERVMNAWAEQRLARHGIPMPEAPACPDCHGIGYDASGQTCACQENPSF